MGSLPFYIPLVFIVTTLVACIIFYAASPNKKIVLPVIIVLLIAQAILALSGFLLETDSIPPRFALVIIPPVFLLIGLFNTTGGKTFIGGISLKYLTILQAVRLPVEIVLYWLFLQKAMPQLMTFEGRNFDIITGITAPIVFYGYFIKKKLSDKLLLAWNLVCLCILLITITNGFLSAPSPFQQFAFDQPNVAVLYFPFVWLPGVVVPLAYFGHIISIIRLLQKIKSKQEVLIKIV